MKPKLGFTFNHKRAEIMGLDPLQSFKTSLHWPIDYVRLGAYWSHIEQQPGRYNTELLTQYINLCQQYYKKVVLTVGVKSPRWPEFYFPKYIKHDFNMEETKKVLLNFIQHIIKTFQIYSCISHWQIENEPLDPSGSEHMTIPFEFLKQETELVRSLDKRPLIISLWGNDLSRRNLWKKVELLSDIIGLDLYFKQFTQRILNNNLYRGPTDSDNKIKSYSADSSKPVWIMELQAEPWEHITDGWRLEKTESMNIDQLRNNFTRAIRLHPQVILFWGVEYWLYQKQKGNNKYVEFIENINRYLK